MIDKYDVYGAVTILMEVIDRTDDPAKLAQIERVLKSLIEAYDEPGGG